MRPTSTDTEMIDEYDNTDDRAAPVRGAIETIDVEPDSNTPIDVIGSPRGGWTWSASRTHRNSSTWRSRPPAAPSIGPTSIRRDAEDWM